MKREKVFVSAFAVVLVTSAFAFPTHSEEEVTFNVGMQDKPETMNSFQAQNV